MKPIPNGIANEARSNPAVGQFQGFNVVQGRQTEFVPDHNVGKWLSKLTPTFKVNSGTSTSTNRVSLESRRSASLPGRTMEFALPAPTRAKQPQRIDRRAPAPNLEVQLRFVDLAGCARFGDGLAGAHGVALRH